MTLNYANLFAPFVSEVSTAVNSYWPPIFAVFVGLFALMLGPRIIRAVINDPDDPDNYDHDVFASDEDAFMGRRRDD